MVMLSGCKMIVIAKSRFPLFSLTLLFLLVACKPSCILYNDPVVKNIIEISKNHDIIDLNDVTNFDWDYVVLCTPGIKQDDLNKVLPGVKKEYVDVRHTLAFICNNKIVYKLFYSADPDNPFPFTFYLGNDYLIINKRDAQFEIVKNNKVVILNLKK